MRPGPGGYAGVVSRGAAFAFDAMVAIVVCTVGFQLTVAILSTVGLTSLSTTSDPKVLGFVLAVPIVFWAYCTVFWSLVGRTPGMMLLGVRVVTVDGRTPGIRRSVIRACGYWVSAVLLLGFVWIAIDQRSQGFHDKLARTFVVYD